MNSPRADNTQIRYQYLAEALGGITVKLKHYEPIFLSTHTNLFNTT
jgi:hypothetical protein